MPARHDSSLVTVLRRIDAARAEQVGSGFLLRTGPHHFLFSAAHILIENTLELPTNPRLTLAQAGHLLATSSFDQRDNPGDKYDVGCIHLAQHAVDWLSELGRTFQDNPPIARNFPPVPRIVCVFAGYPASFSKTKVGLRQVVSTPTYIRGEKLSDEHVRALGHDPSFNFGIGYDREKMTEEETERRINGPVATGMSGGPVWLILPDGPVLVGIGTHYYPEKHALIGSLVAPLLTEAMRRYAGEPVAVTVQTGSATSGPPPPDSREVAPVSGTRSDGAMPNAKPKFAVLGWGSLLWDERPEFAGFNRRLGAWQADGPALRLEFARVSSSREGALTLVLVEAPLGAECTVSYALIDRAKLEDAVCDVRCREGCNMADIGYCRIDADEARGRDHGVVAAIRAWGAKKQLDAVIWTDLPANFADKSDPRAAFSIPAALAHLQKRTPKGKSFAAEYVWRAPDFVKTPLRATLQVAPWFVPPQSGTGASAPGQPASA